MTIRHESWPVGTPAWVDIMVPDRHAARAFYGPLFGWDFDEGSPETGFYTTALKNGEPAAAIGEATAGMATPPPNWTAYTATDNAEVTVAAAAAAGATVLFPAMQVMQFGTMAVLADPTGAVFGLWESGTHTGANIVNVPGTFVWSEQMSRDLEAAKAFYTGVFGYTYTDMSVPGFDYVTFEVNGNTAGGLGAISAEMGDTPPHWLVYFGVDDTDAATAYVTEHGGAVVRPAWDTPFGRMAIVTGPWRETFAIMSTPPTP
jgi:predicted enzyme related to lactoylglutathione lyase